MNVKMFQFFLVNRQEKIHPDRFNVQVVKKLKVQSAFGCVANHLKE